ncbi:MAG: SH3 domain-containing protein [Pseudomonadota bacterium]|nr:SH3 domain-containing protein [Pseudomonadota bacterium]
MAYTLGAFAIGLAVTLVLAAFLTPARWWRRPTLRALALLAAGSWTIGSALLSLAPAPALAAMRALPDTADMPASAGIAPIGPVRPMAGRSFHVFEHLNLRAASGTGARRVAIVPPGALVTASGARDGDWWQVSVQVGGRQVTGWVSSLWLRRAEETK